LVAIRNTEMRFELRTNGGLTAFVAALMVEGDVFALVDELVARPSWQADALCREHPELVFVPSAGPVSDDARALCRSCLVRAECLGYALVRPELVGCWGGTTTADRDRARAEGVDVDEVLARLDRPKPAAVASAWVTAPCTGCGGLLSRQDVAIGDSWCWACRPAA
jgi:Transcription factor WhiB